MTLRAVRDATSREQARDIILAAVQPVVTSILTNEDYERLRQGVLRMPDPPAPGLTKRDWLGALAVFLLVFLSTFPIAIPFLVFRNTRIAIRASNLVAIGMLFACGYWLADHTGTFRGAPA